MTRVHTSTVLTTRRACATPVTMTWAAILKQRNVTTPTRRITPKGCVAGATSETITFKDRKKAPIQGLLSDYL